MTGAERPAHFWAPCSWDLRPGKRLRAIVERDGDTYSWSIEASCRIVDESETIFTEGIASGTAPSLDDACLAAEAALLEHCGVKVHL